MYQRVLLLFHLNKAVCKFARNVTSSREGHQAGPRALLQALCHYVLQVKIKLVEFNLVVSSPAAKPPNLIPHQSSGNTGLPVTTNDASYLTVYFVEVTKDA